jgi:hypothetical protein
MGVSVRVVLLLVLVCALAPATACGEQKAASLGVTGGTAAPTEVDAGVESGAPSPQAAGAVVVPPQTPAAEPTPVTPEPVSPSAEDAAVTDVEAEAATAGPPTYQDAEPRQGVWALTRPQIVSRGSLDESPEGRLRSGFAVQAQATSPPGTAPFERGILVLRLTAFRPAKDMPGQPAGFWYTTGTFELYDAALSGSAAAVRHAGGTLNGVVAARTGFDPGRRGPGRIAASLTVPKWLAGEQWTAGDGSLSVDREYEGELYLQYEEVAAGL